FPLVAELRRVEPPVLALADSALPDLIEAVHSLPNTPLLELPPDVAHRVSQVEPLPCISIGADPEPWRARGAAASVSLGFRYGNLRISGDAAARTYFDRAAGIIYHRHREREAAARARLGALGVSEEYDYRAARKRLFVPQRKLVPLVQNTLREGWHVDMNGALYRAPSATRAAVRSGIDWFDLDASVSYGDMVAPLSALLEARRRGDETIPLEDGSLGLLPLEWLTHLGPLAATGENEHGVTRFKKTQLSLLDALLAALPEVSVDATFERARTELRSFERVEAAAAPTTFAGTLREYQREGLGWLHFLRRFGLGGCLADDMGLGKTVQVLALLDSRRVENAGPSVVVVPRSLVFNWMREAERFTPALRVMDYSGSGRNVVAIDPACVD
ncbi:MAG: SNF2-related protein, partial [Gemmatimonadaceae bacterium]